MTRFLDAYAAATGDNDCFAPADLAEIIDSTMVILPDVDLSSNVLDHDCQRVIDDRWKVWPPYEWEKKYYAPIVVFALAGTQKLGDRDFQQALGTAYRVGLLVNNDPAIGYQNFKIDKERVYCIFLGLEAGGTLEQSDDWWSVLYPCKEDGQDVRQVRRDALNKPFTKRVLRVRRFKPAVGTVLPSGAALHWEQNGNEHSIGIRCGSGWCSISKNRMEEHPEFGWGDHQFLSALDSKLAMTEVRAEIVAYHGAGYNDPTRFYGKWARVADIHSWGYDQLYRDTFNISSAENGDETRSVVELYRREGNLPERDRWVARITTGNRAITLKVIHHPHTQPPLGVARWRWLGADEHFWTSCAAGCCEVTGAPAPDPETKESA